MTGLKVALGYAIVGGGFTSTLSGLIIAALPPDIATGATLAPDSSVKLTLALVFSGLVTTAIASWKVRGAWNDLENKITRHDERITSLEKTRTAEFKDKLDRLAELEKIHSGGK